MTIVLSLCLLLLVIAVSLAWNLAGERRLNANLKDSNNSLNGMFGTLARFERHLRERSHSLALESMTVLVRGSKSSHMFWQGSEFTDLSQRGYLASRVREILSQHLETETNPVVLHEVACYVKQLKGLGLHIDTNQIDEILTRVVKV